MDNICFIAIMFVVCLILREIFLRYITKSLDFKFFIFWICVCVAFYFIFSLGACIWAFLVYCFIEGAGAEENDDTSTKTASSNSSNKMYDKVYEDGTKRISNLSKTGHYYSNGNQSYKGMFGEEHRNNGEVVRDNAYIPGRRDIHDKNGKYIGYEYEDNVGITYRVEK